MRGGHKLTSDDQIRRVLMGQAVREFMESLLAVFCLFAFSCAHARSDAVVIRAVTVVDGVAGSPHPERTVLVAGNRIAAIGSANEVAAPDDAEIVEAAGGYVIPRLGGMHGHSGAHVATGRSKRAI